MATIAAVQNIVTELRAEKINLTNQRQFQPTALKIPKQSPLCYANHVDTSGIAIFERVCALDLEGIVAKYKFDKYEEDRKRSTWFKIRNRKYSQMVDRAGCSSEIVTVSQSPGGIPAKLPVVRRRFDLLAQRAERFGHCASPLFSNVAVTFTTQPGFISTFEVQSLEPARFNSSTGALSAPTPCRDRPKVSALTATATIYLMRRVPALLEGCPTHQR